MEHQLDPRPARQSRPPHPDDEAARPLAAGDALRRRGLPDEVPPPPRLSSRRAERAERPPRRRGPVAPAAERPTGGDHRRRRPAAPRLGGGGSRRSHPPALALRPGRRRRAGPGRQREVPRQARLPRRPAGLGGGRGGRARAADGRLQRGALSGRRVVAPAAPDGDQPHAGRDGGAGADPRGRRLDRRRAAGPTAAGARFHLVELPQRDVAGQRPRPPARPCVGVAAACRTG